MRPWKVSFGLTAALAGVGVFYFANRFDYLTPYSRLLLAEHGAVLSVYAAAALLTFMTLLAAALRSLGMHDVGRKVDLVERSVRRGEGDPELARRLNEEAEGTFSE